MMDGTPIYKNAVFVALVSTVFPTLNMPPLILSTYSETIQALHLKAPTRLATQIGHTALLPFSFPCIICFSEITPTCNFSVLQ